MKRRPAPAALMVVAAFLSFPLVTGCGDSAASSRRSGEDALSERAVGPEAELRDSAGVAPAAGMSVGLRVAIDTLDPDELDGDTASRAYRAFRQRCGGCHLPPSPSEKEPGEWAPVLRRMESHTAEAGLLPIGDVERTVILEFLRRHAEGRD